MAPSRLQLIAERALVPDPGTGVTSRSLADRRERLLISVALKASQYKA